MNMTNDYNRGDAFQRVNDSSPAIETEYVSANDEGRLQGDEEHQQRDAYNDETNENMATQENDDVAHGAGEFAESGNVNAVDDGEN